MNSYKEIRILPEEEQSLTTTPSPVPTSKGAYNASKRLPAQQNTALIIGAVVLVLGIGGGLLIWGRNNAVPPPQPTTAATVAPVAAPPVREPVVATPTAVPTPDCVPAQSQLASIDGLIQKGRWEEAADQAEEALGISNLCNKNNEVRQLTQRAVLAGLNVIYNQEFTPLDKEGQQAAVDQFLRLRERARLADVTFPTLLQVARETYRISHHRLTVAVIETAFADGEFNPAIDRETTRLYISALYGMGYWYTQAEKASALYAEGLSYLVASHQLTVQYKTGQGEAGQLLAQLLGDAPWPAPYQSPLLTAHS